MILQLKAKRCNSDLQIVLDEVQLKGNHKDPRTDADKNTPVAKDQTVKPGDQPNAKDSIGNVGDLPEGTKFMQDTS